MKLNILTDNVVTPDPFIIKISDKYYLYTTHHSGIRLFESDDKVNWHDVGYVITDSEYKDFWAPSVYVENDVIYVYYSMRKKSSLDIHDQKIYVATANSPLGPYIIQNNITPAFSIDPHIVKSGDTLYIFYSTNDTSGSRPGTLIVIDQMISPLRVKGEPKVVLRPTIDEEIFARNRFKKGEHWHTIEGAFYFREQNNHYLMYSGNSYENKYYFISYARAFGDTDDLTKLNFVKFPNEDVYYPLLHNNKDEIAAGHNSVLYEDGNYYIVYHARDYYENNEEAPPRTARIARLNVKDGFLSVNKDRTI